jgi:hypothetical protein
MRLEHKILLLEVDMTKLQWAKPMEEPLEPKAERKLALERLESLLKDPTVMIQAIRELEALVVSPTEERSGRPGKWADQWLVRWEDPLVVLKVILG